MGGGTSEMEECLSYVRQETTTILLARVMIFQTQERGKVGDVMEGLPPLFPHRL